MRFHTPANWPPIPPGWTPPPDWQPDPSWGPAPAGHTFWANDDGTPGAPPQGAWTGSTSQYGSYGSTATLAPPAPPKRKHTLRNVVIVAVGLIVLIAACQAVAGGGDDAEDQPTSEVSEAAATPPPADAPAPADSVPAAEPAPTTEAPPAAPVAPAITFLGQTDSDTVGNVGDTLDVDNTAVTLTPLTPFSDSFSDLLCSQATIVNNDDDTLTVSSFSFELQNPQGASVSATFLSGGGTQLPYADLAPGGQAAGEVCFDGPATAGQNILLYAPISFTNTERGAWAQTF